MVAPGQITSQVPMAVLVVVGHGLRDREDQKHKQVSPETQEHLLVLVMTVVLALMNQQEKVALVAEAQERLDKICRVVVLLVQVV